MNSLLIALLFLTIGYLFSETKNKTPELKIHLKTKLHDLIEHNLALEGYDCLKGFRARKQTNKEVYGLKGKEFDNSVKSKYVQQTAKIVFASGLLRDLGEEQYVNEQWKKYGIKLSRDKNYVIYKKIK